MHRDAIRLTVEPSLTRFCLELLLGMCCNPLAALRLWVMALPYLEWLTFKGGHESVSDGNIRQWFKTAWAMATGQFRTGFRPYLSVISNKLDAPCEGCGGKCCQVAQGEGGFNTMQVLAYEEFAKRHPEYMVPHPSIPRMFSFIMGKRCRFLLRDGKCGVYDHRPSACVFFNCADGLREEDGYWRKSYEEQFLVNVPSAKKRLIELGYKPAPREVLHQVRIAGRKLQHVDSSFHSHLHTDRPRAATRASVLATAATADIRRADPHMPGQRRADHWSKATEAVAAG